MVLRFCGSATGLSLFSSAPRAVASPIAALLITTVLMCVAPIDVGAQEESETIVITAEAPEETPPPGTVVVSAESARAAGARTVAEALRTAPGVTLQASGSQFESVLVRIRGSTSEQVLVLIDGRRVSDSYSGVVDLARIPLDRVERIEIRRGPVNAEYGGGAAGAINIVTRDSFSPTGADPWSGSAAYSFGSFGEHRLGGDVRYDGDALSLGALIGGVISANRYDFERAGDSITRRNAGGRDGYARLTLDNFGRGRAFEIDGGISLESSSRGLPGSIEFPSDTAFLDDSRVSTHLEVATVPSPDIGVRAGIEAGVISRRYEDEEYPLGAIESDMDLRRVGGEIAATWSFGAIELEMMGSARYADLDDLDLGRQTRGAIAAAPGASFSLTDATGGETFRLEATGRGEVVDDTFLPSARASALFRIAAPVRIGMTLGAGNRLPTFLELFQPAGAFVVGNPDLEAERSVSIEGEILFGARETRQLRVSAFLVRYRELIQWIAGPDGRWSPQNTGEARVRGIELDGRIDVPVPIRSWTLSLDGGVEILEAIDTNAGVTNDKQLPYRPRASARTGLGFGHSFGHSIQVDALLMGARPVNAQNTLWLDPYLAIDIAGRMRVPVGTVREWYLHLRVTNLVDTPYVETRSFPNPGREIVLGTEVRW